MNCQDIARMLDEQEVDGLLASEQPDVQAHLATCRDCARDWQIQVQLSNTAIPAVPAELRAHYAAQVMGGAAPGARRRGRFVVIGAVVAMAAAAAMVALQMNGVPGPIAATADPVQVEPSLMHAAREALPSPTKPMSDDESKALAEWKRRVAEWLALRDDPDALITAALLSNTSPRDAQRILLLLQRATTLAPASARIHTIAMLLCVELKPCDAAPYEQSLRRLAPDNALGWVEEVNRSLRADDDEAFQRALTAMSRAKTFDLYVNASLLSMISQIRAALVAPPDIKKYNPSISNDAVAVGAFGSAMPVPAFQLIIKACESTNEEGVLLACRQVGAAMREGDTVNTNYIGLIIGTRGLPVDSAEAHSLAQWKNQITWIMNQVFRESVHLEDDPKDFLRAMANHPREIDGWREWLEEQGMPLEPPAAWKQ